MTLINKNHGVIGWVSPDKITIKIILPRGGHIKAKNEGFEVGDVVAFALNPLGTRVLKVIPKFVADFIVEIGRNTVLQSAIQEEDTLHEHNWTTDGIEEDRADCRPSFTECPDLYGGEYRAQNVGGGDNFEYPDGLALASWPYDYGQS